MNQEEFENKIKEHLEKNHFVVNIVKDGDSEMFAVRESTGKKILVVCRMDGKTTDEENIEHLRLWVKYDMQPFIARENNGNIIYKDVIFKEDLNEI